MKTRTVYSAPTEAWVSAVLTCILFGDKSTCPCPACEVRAERLKQQANSKPERIGIRDLDTGSTFRPVERIGS
jgi:lipoate synthase